MTSPTSLDPWDDDRLDAAFAARARSIVAPERLIDATIAALAAPRGPSSARGWRLLASAAAVVALVVGSVGIGARLLPNGGAFQSGLRVVDGPTPDLRTLDAGEFAFDFPAEWLVYDSSAVGSGISSIAILGTQAVEPRCGDARHVETNCVNEQRLEPGDIRVIVGTGAYRGGTVLDRVDIENGTTTRHTIAGMPAILDTFDFQSDSYYREDLSLAWSIGRPGVPSNVVTIEVRARAGGPAGSGVIDEAKAATDAIVASFRFIGAQPEPTEPPAIDAFGLPVISVDEALAVRDAGADDRELAVRGWFPPSPPISCPAPATWPVSPLQPNCPDQWVLLTREREELFTVEENGMSGHLPRGPSFQLELDGIDSSQFGPVGPVEVVVIGHFDDRRAAFCPADIEAACRDRFTVDRVAWVGGESQPLSVLDLVENGAASTAAEVKAVTSDAVPGVTLLSMLAVGGEQLTIFEPSIQVLIALQDHRAVWIVRTLDPSGDGRSRTYAVIDGSDAVFAINDDGGATFIAGMRPALSPAPSGVPSASGSITVIELTSQIGAGRQQPLVTVVDQADILGGVREVGAEDRPLGSGTDVFTRDPDVDGRYRLSWVGSVCDEAMTVTIEPQAVRIVVDLGVRDACDSLGVGRDLVLDFRESVDTTGVELVIVPARIRG